MTVVDVHTHLAPLLADAAERVIDGEKVGPPSLFSRDALLDYLDTAGIDMALVSVPPPFYRQNRGAPNRADNDGADQNGADQNGADQNGADRDRADAAAWAKTVNDGLLARLDSHPRLRALAYLPLEDPDAAVAEFDRLAAHPGEFAGFVGSAGGSSVSLAAPGLDPLWAALDSARALLFLHPGHSHDHRLDEFYLNNLLGNPVETGVAVAQLVFGEVPARFPGIRFVLAHGGGVVPSVVGRWEQGLRTTRPGVNPAMEAPRASVARLFADSLTYDLAGPLTTGPLATGPDAPAFRAAEAVFGPDRMLLGSDWPFPMGSTDSLADLPADAVERVSSTNAKALWEPGS
jgi:aminocarboxymuconate-semialdehyde decarboxylase